MILGGPWNGDPDKVTTKGTENLSVEFNKRLRVNLNDKLRKMD